MNDSAIFQGLARAWTAGTPPVAMPVAVWRNVFFDCPVAAASHLQRFMGRQMQDQVQLMAELGKETSAATALTKEAAFLQQSAFAWTNEMLELAELMQSKLLTSTQTPPDQTEKPPFANAA